MGCQYNCKVFQFRGRALFSIKTAVTLIPKVSNTGAGLLQRGLPWSSKPTTPEGKSLSGYLTLESRGIKGIMDQVIVGTEGRRITKLETARLGKVYSG